MNSGNFQERRQKAWQELDQMIDSVEKGKPVEGVDELPKKFREACSDLALANHRMYGGSVVWLIDPVLASMDSLQNAEMTMAIPLDVNLNDMLFTYGVRVNTNLIQDMMNFRVFNRPKSIHNRFLSLKPKF